MAKKKIKKAKAKDGAWLYNELTTVRFIVRSKTFEIDIGSELLVSSEDLHGQVERIPALMGYFSTIVSLLEEEYENKKDLKKNIEARIDKKIRETGATGETRIDRIIKRHPKWLEASIEVNAAGRRWKSARGQFYSLKAKAEALNSRSADIRATPSDSIFGVTKHDIINLEED